jgi:dTDP-4-dehydrorhamnose 3,5-epimerase
MARDIQPPFEAEIPSLDTMRVESLQIPEVRLITPPKLTDQRGFLSETYSRRFLVEAGIDLEFVQDNHSLSAEVGTIRGLHFQSPPYAQAKLVRVVRGAILDVAVDIRQGSPTFGYHAHAVLSADNWSQIFIPEGFAHGFCTLEPDSQVLYKVSDYHAPDHDLGLAWNDPALGIDWPVSEAEAVLSDKDRAQPRLAQLRIYFVYEPMTKG